MSQEMLITIIVFGVVALILLGIIIYGLVKGNLRQFVEDKMREAEKKFDNGSDRLKYVIDAVKEKYKVNLLVNIASNIIKYVIGLTKDINYKK